MIDLFFKNTQLFNSQDVNWWTGVMWITWLLWCFYKLFGLSFQRHPFSAENPLESKWCNARFLQICWWRNKLIYILNFFIFGWAIPLMHVQYSPESAALGLAGWRARRLGFENADCSEGNCVKSGILKLLRRSLMAPCPCDMSHVVS